MILLAAVQVAPISLAGDKDKAKITKSIQKILDSFEERVQPVRESFRDAMVAQQKACQKEGNLVGIKNIEDELKAFDRSNTLPSCVPTITYRKSLTAVYETHLADFQELIAKYTRSGKLKLAEEVESEMNSFVSKFRTNFPGAHFERSKWVHSTGRFEQINGVEWVEFTDRGRIPFREEARDFDGVMLVNNHTTIWLLDDHCDAKNGNKKRGFAYRGKWKN